MVGLVRHVVLLSNRRSRMGVLYGRCERYVLCNLCCIGNSM